MPKYICYTPTTSPRFITEQGVLMNERTSNKQNMLETLGGVCLEDGNYSAWEFPENTELPYKWAQGYFSEEGKEEARLLLRKQRLSPTAL
jgi:hypothetical protein